MRIPLDYYQVLGILPEAPEEQIGLAYQDKIVQMPHLGFSESALDARRTLLKQAQTVLSDPDQRREYDQLWWGKSGEKLLAEVDLTAEEPEPETEKEPFLEVEESQLIGALLILQELGDYALSLELAEMTLQSQSENTDYLLILALSYLELSRDQWHNQDYEQAAASVLKALARLQTVGQFPALQEEIREELYKLRPYRIFELLTRPQTEVGARQRGVDLLRALIQDRGGIEGRGNDQSGLNGEDFVKFIQQLRGHLTLEEQAELFLPEASRPSALAAYLGFHTQVAKAVTQKQPAQLQVAQQLLDTLANRQDVTLEKAICALLLGQTESALDWVTQTQDAEALSAIRDLSQNEPDLLPGLYVYTENWLQEELSPYFCELPPSFLRLDDYFNDLDVQNSLETYSLTPPLSSPPEPSALPAMAIPLSTYPDDRPEKRPLSRRRSGRLRTQSATA
ncbi:MAG: J domain-containing protein, partial [Cyanobacteriota bacterium]